jgi:hypothetical protein
MLLEIIDLSDARPAKRRPYYVQRALCTIMAS